MKTVLRNYTPLKLFFAALTVFLLYEEFYIFSVEKPTHTTSARLRIGNRHIVSSHSTTSYCRAWWLSRHYFVSISISQPNNSRELWLQEHLSLCQGMNDQYENCDFNPKRPKTSQTQNYCLDHWYLHIIDHSFEGIIHGSYLQGWSGNSSLTTTEEIIRNISLFRTPEDCPYARVELLDRNNDKKHFVPLAFELTSMLHPAGQCCQAVIPEQASKWIINGLLVSIKPKLNSLLGKP